MQLSTMMGISFLLSCWSFSVLALPPAAFWMSAYHREKSVRPMPCRCRVLNTQTHNHKHIKIHFDKVSVDIFDCMDSYICKSQQISKVKAHLPFSTRTKMSFFSWLSVSDAIPLKIYTEKKHPQISLVATWNISTKNKTEPTKLVRAWDTHWAPADVLGW